MESWPTPERQARDLVSLVEGLTEATPCGGHDVRRALELTRLLNRPSTVALLRNSLAELVDFLMSSEAAREHFVSQLDPAMLSELQQGAETEEVRAKLHTLCGMRGEFSSKTVFGDPA